MSSKRRCPAHGPEVSGPFMLVRRKFLGADKTGAHYWHLLHDVHGRAYVYIGSVRLGAHTRKRAVPTGVYINGSFQVKERNVEYKGLVHDRLWFPRDIVVTETEAV